MTPGQLRQIAEACGYTLESIGAPLPYYRDERSVLVAFRPHLDANQAIECLNRRFGTNWWLDPVTDGFTVSEISDKDRRALSHSGPTFPLAAMAAILESLKENIGAKSGQTTTLSERPMQDSLPDLP